MVCPAGCPEECPVEWAVSQVLADQVVSLVPVDLEVLVIMMMDPLWKKLTKFGRVLQARFPRYFIYGSVIAYEA